ncbi:hypothetical protein IPA_05880 [Ignicoccus pacificus DSM 13166]|uniref:Uncharacterized protein n=1 Tax=Ignicoccus pacificus DSM 13166 TaxID=940294 RepID=A0A977PLI1_9CREN|nr:hypothetical protein IPA_05880 [Ignicoccus pacificus DSM 13166]
MISARSAEKQAKKGLTSVFGENILKNVEVQVEEGEGSLSMIIKFEVGEGEISAGGEKRKVKPGTYEMKVEVTFGKRGKGMIEARFAGRCGESQLSDLYVVEEKKADYIRSWLADKIGALAIQCATEAEESADIGGLLGW